MLVVRQQHFVTLLELEAADDEVHPFSRVAREGNLIRVGVDERRGFLASLFHLLALSPVRLAGVLSELAVLVDNRVEHRFGARPERPVVHVRELVGDHELLADLGPERGVGRVGGGADGGHGCFGALGGEVRHGQDGR